METLKDLLKKPEHFAPGHRTCRGCAIPIIVRSVLRATDNPLVVVNATGCMEVTTTLYPQTSWNMPYMHNAFENAPATMSGILAVYQHLKEKKKIPENVKFVVFGGDGSTYDIGLQSLSGAWERGDNFLYVCYDNQVYSNTGGQRSSATPLGASTSTTPAGKIESRKDIMKIAAAHNLPYLAQAAIHNWFDLHQKAKKALSTNGPTFLNILCPCVANWKYNSDLTVKMSQLATETCFWPLYEIENGVYKLNYQPREKLPVEEFLKFQGRFKNLFSEKDKNNLIKIQQEIDKRWQELTGKCPR
ncbi:MAG: thiamine pyrophosphate-dependent enzyme [Patescibacteria group bacterium]